MRAKSAIKRRDELHKQKEELNRKRLNEKLLKIQDLQHKKAHK